MPERSVAFRLLLAAVLPACSCSSEDSGPRAITTTREIDIAPGQHQIGATSEDRFGSMTAPNAAEPAAPARELVWDNPPGWIELPPTEMRRANLQPAGNPDAECYFSVLGGGGGGMLDNVNRWRGQMGQPPLDAAGVAALPKRLLMGLDGVLVELEGDFTAMGGAAKSGYVLRGVIAAFGEQALFVKLTGPAAAVAAEAANFDAFANSLRLEEVGASAAHDEHDGHDHAAEAASGAGSTSGAAAANPLGGSNQGIEWSAPSGWTRDPDRATRVATLRPPNTTQTECAITSLSSDGGGIKSNVDRWRGQIGLGPISVDELADLPTVTLCGKEGVLLDLIGAFEDSMNQRSIPQARMLGAMVLLGDRSLFVKMTGPETEIDDVVRDAFRELCASLKR
ncbi:MAG: hypothetical protein EXS13_08200 [Planctomycetes bacterium]|nr:hypothetical protein [Planctomycetota bacterium]